MSTIVKPITLWKAQREFFEWGPSPCMFMGGVGSGKSHVLVLKMLYLLDQYPGSRGLIARQRFQQLKKTTSATLWKMLSKSHVARRNDNEGTLTLTNGSQLLLMHLDSADSLSNLKSLEINFGAVDQAEDISAEAWDTLWERIGRWSGATKRGGWPADWPYKNRLGEPIPPRYLFANCYSPGYEHWITSRFWEYGQDRKRYAAEGYKAVIGSTRDNLALSDEYVESRLSMGDEYVRRFVDAADWGAKEGRIFDLTPFSILEPTPDLLSRIKRSMRLHRVYDHGEAVPSACLWYATDNEQNVFFYREYGAADKLVSDHRAAIYEMSKEDGQGGEPPKYYSNLADPAIFAKSRGRSVNAPPTWSVADEFVDRRIIDPKTAIAWRPANNNEAMTINRLREYMRPDPRHRHPTTGRLGAPRIYFIRKTDDYPWGCHEVLTDIRAAKRVEVGTLPDGSKLFGDERDERVRDHWLDCLTASVTLDTPDGPVRIADAPVSGTVCTPVGDLTYVDCKCYAIGRELVRVDFASGRSVTCTPDHRLLTEAGWVEAKDMLGHQCLSRPQSKSSWVSGTLSVVATFSAAVARASGGFIEWCGRVSTDLSQLGSAFTTLMAIPATTTPTTFNSSLTPSTCDITTEGRSTPRGPRSMLPERGTAPSQGWSGTASTPLSPSVKLIARLRRPANFAAKATSRISRLLYALVSARQRAKLPTFDAAIRVTPAGTGDVYCLTVQHPLHAFYVNGGLAVANCVRYALGMRPSLGPSAPAPPPEPGTIRLDEYMKEMARSDAQARVEHRRNFRGHFHAGYGG